jgi:hypothetical protein
METVITLPHSSPPKAALSEIKNPMMKNSS